MADPVHQAQLQLWRARHMIQKESAEGTRLDGLDEAGRERFFRTGSDQVATLAARIEAQTGCKLEGMRVLDFGCGVGRTALPLAERCEHVYGLDVSPAVLREADRYAQSMNLSNVEWLLADRLDEVIGKYDLVVSFWVFQHMPSREGERIFGKLVRGL
jgi:cyclopropane fatty-acyl-phospholipid synthase-like methyltransferase